MERKRLRLPRSDRKSTRLNSSHSQISYAVFCLKKKVDGRDGVVRRQPTDRLGIPHSISQRKGPERDLDERRFRERGGVPEERRQSGHGSRVPKDAGPPAERTGVA